jgi:hypothetical protein
MGLADQQSNKLSCIWCEMQLSCIRKGSKSQQNAAFLRVSGAAYTPIKLEKNLNN